MDNSAIEKFVEKIIETHLEQSIDQDQIDSLLEHLDIRNLSKEIASKLSERTLTYQTYNVKGDSYCQECFRPHGIWNGITHGGFEDRELLKNGKTIIVIDDF